MHNNNSAARCEHGQRGTCLFRHLRIRYDDKGLRSKGEFEYWAIGAEEGVQRNEDRLAHQFPEIPPRLGHSCSCPPGPFEAEIS